MATYDYRDDKSKYYTRITEYKYSREVPGSTAKRTVENYYYLPLPENLPNDHYSADVQSFDLGEIGTSIDIMKRGMAGSSMVEMVGAAAAGGVAISGIMAAMGIKAGAHVTDALAKGGVTAAAALPFASAYGGVTRNPHTALIFNKMNMRTFSLGFKMSPRNQAQSRRINDIINMLKLRMHPTYNTTGKGFALDYPNLFTVQFAGLDYEGYPKIDFSFLQDMQVNNSPQGVAVYKGGYPSFIELQLQFGEIDMKTRESFSGLGPSGQTPRGSERF